MDPDEVKRDFREAWARLNKASSMATHRTVWYPQAKRPRAIARSREIFNDPGNLKMSLEERAALTKECHRLTAQLEQWLMRWGGLDDVEVLIKFGYLVRRNGHLCAPDKPRRRH